MKKFNYIAFVLIFITALIVRINAATTSYNDIPNNSYVIGTHLYTNEVPLTIKHIMLASNTIEGNTLSDMKLYYKTSRGKWIDGLTGEEKTHLSSYTINYRNSETTSTYYENANTSEMNKNDIPNNSYVIGSHLYTSEMPLTTNHIMLASRTISENRLSNMKIYYKTARGKWIDGVSGEEVTVSNSINISHINLEQVAKQTGYITLNETKKTITYGTNTVTFNVVSSHGGTISVVDNNSTSTITKDGNTITVSNLKTIDAGTTITVIIRSAETSNYTEASTTYLIAIAKADPTCPTVTEYSGTYDAKEHTVTVSGGLGGTIKYEKSTDDGTTYTDQDTTNPVRKSAGTTYIRVRIEGDNNHNDKTCDTKTITLAKKAVTIKASDQSKEYDGTALEADTTCEVTSGSVVSGHTLSCTSTGSQTDVGSSTKTLSTAKVMSGSSNLSSNYTITKENGTLTVNPKEVSVVWGSTTTFTYNGSAQAPTASVTTGVTGETMTVNRTQETNAGSNYTSTASCSSVSGGQAKCSNYTLTNTTQTFKINKKAVTIKASDQSKKYDGTALEADTTCEVTSGSVVSGHTLSCTSTGSQTDVGSSTKTLLTAKVMSGSSNLSSNYTITKENGTLTVNPKEVSVVWGSTTTFTYNGSAQAPTASVTTGVTGETMTVNRTQETNAGSNYTSTASCSSVSGGQAKCSNYTLTNTTQTFKINKKAVTIKASDQSKKYDGTALEADTTCEATSGSVVSGHTLSCTSTGSQTDVGSSTKTLSTARVMSGSSNLSSNYTITKENGILTVLEADITALYIQYNGNGGTWNNPVRDTYAVNENGTVVIKSTNEIYNSTYYYGESLPSSGLLDYNAGYLNWIRDGYHVVTGEEYFIDGTDTVLDQSVSYNAEDLADAINCDLATNDCTIVVKVNWVSNILSIKYNGNGGTWNENSIPNDKKLYIDNQSDGMVRLRSTNEIYIEKHTFSDHNINLIDHNGGYLNWTKEGHHVATGEEYFIDGTDTVLDQAASYNAEDLADAISCDLATNDCTIVVKVNWVENALLIKYNGNGGTWNNPVNDTYGVNENGMVIKNDTGKIYVDSHSANDQSINFIDYNGGYLNWRKSDAGVPPESEYYVLNESTNEKTYLNQMNNYSAVDIASAAGCTMTNNSCTVVVYVNWEQYLITDADYLKTSGTKFVKTGINGSTGNNNGVVLRGFNLGAWLSRAIANTPIANTNAKFDVHCDIKDPHTQEIISYATHASPYCDLLKSDYWREYADNDVQINYDLYKRFGKDAEFELNEIYYKNFITEEDINYLDEIGINAVRVPLAWSYFVNLTYNVPTTPPVIGYNTKPYDINNYYSYSYSMLSGDKLTRRLQHLDWIVHECRKHGIYVIFDLHVVDGGQSDYGLRPTRGFTFYDDQSAQNNAIEVWKIVSKRFKGNPGVAGFELLNEPSSGIGPKGDKYITDRGTDNDKYRDELIRFYDMAYKAIRDIDADHIIIMEAPYPGHPKVHQVYLEDSNGNPLLTLPTESERTNGINNTSICPATKCKWTNVAYSLHDYFKTDNKDKSDDTYIAELKAEIASKVHADYTDMQRYKVPIYIGETNFTYTGNGGDYSDLNEYVTNAVWPYALNQYDSNLFSYTIWNYKITRSIPYGVGYNMRGGSEVDPIAENIRNYFPMLLTDDYDTIAAKWSKKTSEAAYTKATIYESVLKDNFINKSNKPLFANYSYTCKAGATITSTIKIFSKDGNVTINDINTSDSNVATVSFVDPAGVVCTSTSCKTIRINCRSKGNVTLTATASNGVTSTATVAVSNN